MKKRIAFVTKALWIGGIETALVNMLNQFDYEKYDVTLIVLQADLDLLDQIDEHCHIIIIDRKGAYSFKEKYKYTRLFHLIEDCDNPSFLHRSLMWTKPCIRWIENALYIRYVRSCLEKEKFDTCVIYSDVVAEIGIRSVKADKYLMFYHHGAMRRVYHDRIAYDRCERIIAVSEVQAELLKGFMPETSERIVAIHNLTNTKKIVDKAEEEISEAFSPDFFNIVTVGRVSHEKGMDNAVRACAELVTAGHTRLRWWIVGDGPAMDEVRRVIAETHMESYIILTGMKSNPYPYMKKADLYVQPSRFEGYPMTILEALVLGQPVISTDNNGAREILTPGKTGVLCECNPKKIAGVIENLLMDQTQLSDMKKNVSGIDFSEENRNCLRALEREL